MNRNDCILLKDLFKGERVMSLSLIVDGKPYVSLVPFAFQLDLCSVFIQTSDMARHSAGLFNGAPFTLLIHTPDKQGLNPMELPRVSLSGSVTKLVRDSVQYNNAKDLYVTKFKEPGQFFDFSDFNLYQLNINSGRFVAGFGRIYDLDEMDIRSL